MLEAVSLFIICLVTHILDCYIFSKLINEKFKVNLKNILIVLIFSIIDFAIGISCNEIIKIVVTNFITLVILKSIFFKSISKTFVGSLLIYIGYAISELFYGLIIYLLLGKNSSLIFENELGMFISNVIIFIICILIYKIKKILTISKNIINWCDEKKYLKILINCIITIIICTILMYPISFNNVNKEYYIFLYTILVGILVFVIGYFNEKSNNNQLTVKYDNLLDYVKDYELEVVEKGKAIHEHKNQLAVIDDMIPKNNKKLKKYVSEKLDKVSKLDDNVWLEKLTNLPTGGTKGLVYLKIKKMLDNNISIYVEIDDDLKTKNKWNNVSKNLEDYTRILGVYLDNAIEASIESKDKQIIIEFIDNEDNIEFILSNTYKGRINVEEIDKEKYSTKGKGRGYGLSLVKDIVEKNKLISQSREINGKFYVQKLCIKK